LNIVKVGYNAEEKADGQDANRSFSLSLETSILLRRVICTSDRDGIKAALPKRDPMGHREKLFSALSTA
jgi:hypothetical protein